MYLAELESLMKLLGDVKYSFDKMNLITGLKSTEIEPTIPYKAPRMKVRIVIK